VKLPYLKHDWIDAGIGRQRRSVLEATDISDLAQSDGPSSVTDLHAGLNRMGVRRAIRVQG